LVAKACIDNWKKLVKQQYLHIHHKMMNLSPLTAEISSGVWGTLANFNRFHVLLHQHHSMEVNQTLHDVWSSPGLVHYVYASGGSCPAREFWQVQNSLCIQILHSHILAALHCMALEQWASANLCGVQQRAPPMLSRAAITLGIGPHSSIGFKVLL